MSEAILTVRELRKQYGDHEVVKGISFSVQEGEVFGLLGPNKKLMVTNRPGL